MTIPFACDMTAIPADLPDEYDAVTEFVGRERLCCPFLTFTLEVTPDRGPLRLRLAGTEGVKDFIRAELRF